LSPRSTPRSEFSLMRQRARYASRDVAHAADDAVPMFIDAFAAP